MEVFSAQYLSRGTLANHSGFTIGKLSQGMLGEHFDSVGNQVFDAPQQAGTSLSANVNMTAGS